MPAFAGIQVWTPFFNGVTKRKGVPPGSPLSENQFSHHKRSHLHDPSDHFIFLSCLMSAPSFRSFSSIRSYPRSRWYALWTSVTPLAARPARMRHALALRSVAWTCAPEELFHPLHLGRPRRHFDASAHTDQFLNVHKPIFEHVFSYSASSISQRHKGHVLSLKIGGKTRIRIGLDTRLFIIPLEITLTSRSPTSKFSPVWSSLSKSGKR